ncbi:MAG TPA: response regulator [Candidatus Brocadiia bacterium]|nr:response regulator [Candidatus Brocadiia bacterium]
MSFSQGRFYTTGEAAAIIGISPSSVIRMFDRGELAGKRHPLTGKRLVSRESLARFLESHGLPLTALRNEQRRVLIVDGAQADAEALAEALSADGRVEVKVSGEGCAVCGLVMESPPHFLLVNIDLPDMSGRNVIRSVRNLPLPEPVEIGLCAPPGKVVDAAELEEMGAKRFFPKPWKLDEVAAQIRVMAGLHSTERHSRSASHEHRRSPRFATNWPAKLELYLKNQPRAIDVGQALVKDISEGGAYLDGIQLKNGAFPASPFLLSVKIIGGKAEGFQAQCHPVRIDTRDALGLGVRFDKLAPDDLNRIRSSAPA